MRYNNFKIISEIVEKETIAVNRSLYVKAFLENKYGKGRWRKLKGVAMVELEDGTIAQAELHWYEAHGIGKRQMKIKELLD
jgi:hypothetical protein